MGTVGSLQPTTTTITTAASSAGPADLGSTPDVPLRVIHIHQVLRHHAQLFQRVGVLRVLDVTDVLKHLQGVNGLTLVVI